MNQLFLKQNNKHCLEKQMGSIIETCAYWKKINWHERNENCNVFISIIIGVSWKWFMVEFLLNT